MSIPRIPGPYQVGLTYCKVPIGGKKTYGTAKFKSSAKPAFVSEEIAFQVFYPCDNSSNQVSFGPKWLDRLANASCYGIMYITDIVGTGRPLAMWADGYSTFLGTMVTLSCLNVLTWSLFIGRPRWLFCTGAPAPGEDVC
jgi:hypothetical protein